MTEVGELLAQLKADQRSRWQLGESVYVETYLNNCPQLRADSRAVLDLIGHEIVLRRDRGDDPTLSEYLQRFQEFEDALRQWFQAHPSAGGPFRTQLVSESSFNLRTDSLYSAGPRQGSLPEVPGYHVLSELGRGGMGVVYKARHNRLRRIVALKMIVTGAYASLELQTRIRTEAEAVARLQHANIVQIFEVGDHETLPFLALEYVDGGSLEQKASGKALPAREAARLVEAIARGIHHAHQHGILHRDLKPSNILLTADGMPKITDFGLAKLLDAETGPTPTEAFLGTPSYMSPEQAAGNTRGAGVQADVYGLGAILYALLTGGPPFKGTTLLNTLEKIRNEEPVPPARLQKDLPRDLESVCLCCLEKEPARRYASAAALADDLCRFREGRPIQARPIGSAQRLWRVARRRPTLIAKVIVGIALLCLMATSFWYVRVSDQLDHQYTLLFVLAEAQSQQSRLAHHERCRSALQTLDRAGRLGLDTRAYHLRRALLLEQMGETEEARKEREQARIQPPQSSLDHFLNGEENYRKGAWAAARTDFNRALTIQPAHFWAQFFLAVCHLRLGEWEAARAGFNACLARRANFVWTHLFRGFANEKLGAFREAEEDFDNAFRLDPDSDARYTLLLTRGVLRFQQKQLEPAADDFRSAIALRPEQYNAYANLAWIHLARGDFEKAAEQVDSAARLHPPPLVTLGYHVERARRLCQAGKHVEALADCDKALRVVPENPLAQAVRARSLLGLERYAEAELAYDEYLRHGGEHTADVFRGRGLARMKRGRTFPPASLRDDYPLPPAHGPALGSDFVSPTPTPVLLSASNSSLALAPTLSITSDPSENRSVYSFVTVLTSSVSEQTQDSTNLAIAIGSIPWPGALSAFSLTSPMTSISSDRSAAKNSDHLDNNDPDPSTTNSLVFLGSYPATDFADPEDTFFLVSQNVPLTQLQTRSQSESCGAVQSDYAPGDYDNGQGLYQIGTSSQERIQLQETSVRKGVGQQRTSSVEPAASAGTAANVPPTPLHVYLMRGLVLAVAACLPWSHFGASRWRGSKSVSLHE